MKGLIFAGLLACAHGLGDTQPYTNAQDHSFAAFGAGEWILNTCITGTKQSPIDIVQTAAVVQKPDVGAIMSTGFDTNQPISWNVNGRSTAVTFLTAVEAKLRTPAFITGGPLDESYEFSHLEFHWHKTAGSLGGEHSIDGVISAMEMHAVHFKTKGFTAAQEAAAFTAFTATAGTGYSAAVVKATTAPVDPAGVAVIAYQFDVGAENAELKPLTDAMAASPTGVVAGSNPQWTTGGVLDAAQTTPTAATSVNMSALMMLDQGMLDDYFYYDGSLTQPADVAGTASANNIRASCAEIVRWIIPAQRLTLSAAQLAAFNTRTDFGRLTTVNSNSRPVQTGARIAGITLNRRVPTTVKDNAVWRNLAGTLLSVGTFGLVHNLLTQDETAKALTENPVVDILQDIEQRFARPAPQERQSFNHHHHPQDIQY